MSNREACSKLIDKDYPVEIISETESSDCRIIEGKFLSPLELHLPGLVPEAAKNAHFQIVLPKVWKDEDYKPVCLHLAGTGDHVSLRKEWKFRKKFQEFQRTIKKKIQESRKKILTFKNLQLSCQKLQ